MSGFRVLSDVSMHQECGFFDRTTDIQLWLLAHTNMGQNNLAGFFCFIVIFKLSRNRRLQINSSYDYVKQKRNGCSTFKCKKSSLKERK
jgi:hypothetical protein